MAKYFRASNFKSVDTGNKKIHNEPVNLFHCKGLRKTEKYFGVSNEIKYHAIELIGAEIVWLYATEENRDREYRDLLQERY